MENLNGVIVGAATFVTALVGLATWWTGYKGKGKEQDHAQYTVDRDQLQEDYRNARKDLADEREAHRLCRCSLDESERRLIDERHNYGEDVRSDQSKRHELRSIVRGLVARVDDHNESHPETAVGIEDLRRRAKDLA